MLLPTSRDTTYTPGDPVKSADLNDIQDCIVGNKKKATTRVVSPFTMQAIGGTPFWSAIGNGYVQSPGACGGIVPLYMETGDRFTGLTISSWGNGASSVLHSVFLVTAAMVQTTLATGTDLNRAAAWGDFAIAPVAGYVLAAGECLYLYSIGSGAPSSAGCRIGNLRYTYDRL